jgi:glyoxylase-like metal-dependent hydrolase (beta-lactamase superfamily II)
VRVLALHSDVIVFVSRVWQTTATAVRAGDEGFLIDSPVYPDELEAVPRVLEQAGFPVSGLLATHADWDHLLGPLAFGDRPLGLAESSAERLTREPGAAQRELRAFDDEHYVERGAPLQLSAIQHLPVPGKLGLGHEHELELHPASGHTTDGVAVHMPWLSVLVCGDYLSPVEIPMVTDPAAYLATLERLRDAIQNAETVVPGHGAPQPSARALALLDEDVAYVSALQRDGAATPLPGSRRTAAQKRVHEQNVGRVGRVQPPA